MSNWIQLKRQHSFEPLSAGSVTRRSPASNTPTAGSTPPKATGFEGIPPPLLSSASYQPGAREDVIGSPMKRARASLSGADSDDLRQNAGLGAPGMSGDIMGRIEQDQVAQQEKSDEEEL